MEKGISFLVNLEFIVLFEFTHEPWTKESPNKTKSILVRGYNEINNSNCAINHCEISLINNACKKLNSKYLINTTLFISLEPCIMCAAAISEVHISKVYFGAYSINNDGLEDIYFSANLLPDRLYLNQGNLKFKDICWQ